MSNHSVVAVSRLAMKHVVMAVLLMACGSKQPTQPAGPGSGSAEPVGVVKDTRTPIEQRRDAACDQLGPRLSQCAVDDARADLAAGKITQEQFAKDTASGVVRKNSEEFEKKCKVPMSSRQVRVLEVCFKEETACAPLLDCLGHLQDAPK